MYYQSMKGRYGVDVAADGAIKVKPGDWLSKYSAAIHANYYTIHVFARKNRAGRLERVANPNLIYAGETLYHLPTYDKFHKKTPDIPVPILTEEQKQKLTLEHLKKEFNLKGDNLPLLNKVLSIIGTPGTPSAIPIPFTDKNIPVSISDALTLAECAGLIAETGALATASTVLSFAGIFLLPVAGAIMIANAMQTGLRHIGMRAIAYATTAWAFDDAVPGPPAWISPTITDAKLRSSIQADPGSRRTYEQAQASEKAKIDDMRKAWNDSAKATVKNLDAEVVKRNVQKKSYQVLLRAIGDDDRQTLTLRLMKELEKEIQSAALRRAFWEPQPRYPNR